MFSPVIVAHLVLAIWGLGILIWLEYAPYGRLVDALVEWALEVRNNIIRSSESPLFTDYQAAQEIADGRLERFAGERAERMERLRRRVDEGRASVERIDARQIERKVARR